jgi:hypothetical protein
MKALAEPPVMQPPTTGPLSKPPMPREHGAWGILLVPFATAPGISGIWDIPVTLLLVSVLGFFMARVSFLKQQWKWAVVLLATSAAAGAPLLFVWHRWWLLAFGAVAAPLAFRKTDRNPVIQLLSMTGLTLTAPAAWYVATGNLDAMAWRLWVLNSVYFAGGFFFVKMHLAAAVQKTTDGVRTAAIVYHAALAVALATLVVIGQISWAVALAFVPAVARAAVGAWRLTSKLQIKRLAWGEVTYSILFGLSLIAAVRWVW